MVHHLWDAAALMCLDSESLRYTDLHRKMTTLADRYLSESELTRTRHRLIRRNMISETPQTSGSKLYTITDTGRERLYQIRVLVAVAPRLASPEA
uniref:winged helix-turn-helix transcriptional regulator n=1 Tax=Paractinoplanes polyasparticus TaxID=2856853 RepID=UPI001C8427A8|nr:winged helix-turn-helix transcriptional regulator [Actinoplanes polyasparticus]